MSDDAKLEYTTPPGHRVENAQDYYESIRWFAWRFLTYAPSLRGSRLYEFLKPEIALTRIEGAQALKILDQSPGELLMLEQGVQALHRATGTELADFFRRVRPWDADDWFIWKPYAMDLPLLVRSHDDIWFISTVRA